MQRRPRRWILGTMPLWLTLLGAGPQDGKSARPQGFDTKIVPLKSGTVVGNGPPAGWSDLVLKSSPRLESGDLGTLPSSASTTATLFRPVVVAKVERAEGSNAPYVLTRVGMGMCMPYQGADRVVSSDDLGAAGDSLGMIQRTVLSHAEAEQGKARIIARTPTFALMATPARLKVGADQKPIYLCYAMMADQETGRVRSVVWAIAAQENQRTGADAVVLLKPDLVYPTGLDVKAGRILGAIPVSWEFAIRSLPPGERVPISGTLKALSGNPRKIAADPATFEQSLRNALVVKAAGPSAPKAKANAPEAPSSSTGPVTRTTLPSR